MATVTPRSPQDRFDAIVDAIVAETGWCGSCIRRDDFAKLCCPAHLDRSPSLAVYLNEDGRIWPKCFAGCEPFAVLSAVGMSSTVMYPAQTSGAARCHGKCPSTRRRRDRGRRRAR